MRFIVRIACILLPICACEASTPTSEEWSRLTALANLGLPAPDPANKYVGNVAAERLGQKFYFDARFSGDATQVDTLRRLSPQARTATGTPVQISCASCHDPTRGGSDHTSSPGHVSVGAGWYDVNAQSTVNSAYYRLKYWNGRYDSLVWQIVAVTESPVSMNFTRLGVAWLINEHYRAEYDSIFTDHPFPTLDGRFPRSGKPGQAAFDDLDESDREAITRVYVNFAKAIAAYEYRLVSRNSGFDKWVSEGPDSTLISPAARRGARLFVGKASCIECHRTPLFSDDGFHNVGVPQLGVAVPREAECLPGARCDCVAGSRCLPWGWYTGLQLLKGNTLFRIQGSRYSDDPNDTSRVDLYEAPLTEDKKGAWRTPSLREVSKTPPYMHNGFYRSLEEVVRHYNRGGTSEGASPSQLSKRLRPLGLDDQEVTDLVAFLKTLDGEPLPEELVLPPPLPGL
jgi:cytochrome c peroxidase